MESKTALIETFGTEIGSKLFGAAVKVSAQLNVELDDFCQDLAAEALKVQAEYGYVNVKIAVKHAKNTIYDTYNYGVNRYFSALGVSEFSVDATAEQDTDENALLDVLTFDRNAVVRESLADDFAAVIETLSAAERAVLVGLAEGWQAQEIAQKIGRSNAWVSQTKKHLQVTFAPFAY